MTEHASYIITTYNNFLSLPEDKLFHIGRHHVEGTRPIPSFDEKLLINLCNDAINVFKNEETVINVDGDTFIVGDIHGSYHDLLRILNFISTTPNKIIFLGDYVDRGNFSLECITLLFAFKIMYPDKYFLLRGNHEFDTMCSQYGFKKAILNNHNPQKVEKFSSAPSIKKYTHSIINFNDVEKQPEEEETTEMRCDMYFSKCATIYCYKYTEQLYNAFLDAFSYMPISAIVNKSTFCIHGGLSPLLDKVERITKIIKRPITKFDQNQLLTDLLWSDPSPESEIRYTENPRGRGKLFNKTATYTFLKNNNLQRIIRAHECVNDGVEFNFDDMCITVFSASSYNYDQGNKSGIVQLFQKDDRVNSINFCPLRRLKKFDAMFYKVQTFIETGKLKTMFHRFNIKTISNGSGLSENEKSDKTATGVKIVKQSSSFSRRKAIALNQTISFNTCKKMRKNSFDLSSLKEPLPSITSEYEDNDDITGNAKTSRLPYLNKLSV